MFKRTFATIAAILLAILIGAPCAPSQPTGAGAGNSPIACTVMEAFEEGKLGVRAVVFHQRDKADGPRLGSLLLAHTGEEMELQTPGGQRYRATVFRVKSAFGRGLLLTPVSRFKLSEHDEFTLRLPGKN